MESRHLPLGRLPELAPAEVHVWYARPAELHLPTPVAARDRRQALLHARMQQQFLLRLLLGGYLGCPGRDLRILRSPAGKPILDPGLDPAASAFAFSLSHAGGWLAIAVARGLEPGIDIEPSARCLRWHALARRWFPADEARAVEQSELPAREFLRRWTAREAMIKAMGETLAASLSGLQFDPRDPDLPTRVPARWPEASLWSIRRPDAPAGLEVCLAGAGMLRGLRTFHLGVDTSAV